MTNQTVKMNGQSIIKYPAKNGVFLL